MHSIGSISARRTSMARPASRGSLAPAPGSSATSGTRAAISAGSAVTMVPGARSASSAHQKAVMAVSTRPLSGMGSAKTTSKAQIRSEATISSSPSPGVVELADLAAMDERRRSHRAVRPGRSTSERVEEPPPVAQDTVEVECPVERCSVERHLGVVGQHLAEVPAAPRQACRASRWTIAVRLVAGRARRHQGQQHRLAEHQAEGPLGQVVERPFGVDDQPGDEAVALRST